MRVKPFFVVFVVLVGVVIYAYYAPEKKPRTGTMVTPKKYIEMVQEERAERRRQKAQEQPSAQPPSR
ncbi:MAG TPA: hypothetical protein ENK50_11325 [Sedimenticola sp.]|nr:hypothetical protein [Sedimenticola sp.]